MPAPMNFSQEILIRGTILSSKLNELVNTARMAGPALSESEKLTVIDAFTAMEYLVQKLGQSQSFEALRAELKRRCPEIFEL